MTIMLIDDDTRLLRSLRRALVFLSPDTSVLQPEEILTFDDPEQALATAIQAPPEVVLIDYVMPKITGLQWINAYRDELPDSTTWIGLISTYTSHIPAKALDGVKLDAILDKPISHQRLLDIIRDNRA